MENRKYVELPIDITNVKEKWFAGMSKREFVFTSVGSVLGLVLFWILKDKIGWAIAIAVLAVSAFLFFFIGRYRKSNGMFLEESVKQTIDFYRKPKIRTYKSHNLLERIELEIELKELKKELANGTKRK